MEHSILEIEITTFGVLISYFLWQVCMEQFICSVEAVSILPLHPDEPPQIYGAADVKYCIS
jgi:hypothetical protein